MSAGNMVAPQLPINGLSTTNTNDNAKLNPVHVVKSHLLSVAMSKVAAL